MKSHVRKFLQEELPVLVEKRVLTPEAARALEEYYPKTDRHEHEIEAIRLFVLVLAGVFAAGGILFLFAHNWDVIPRWGRTILSLFPVLISGVAAGLVLMVPKWKDSVPLYEGTGAFGSLAFGATLALIGQVYHLPADPPSFFFIWGAVAIAWAYLLRSGSAAIISLILGLAGSVLFKQDCGLTLSYWFYPLALIPFLIDRLGDRNPMIAWAYFFWGILGMVVPAFLTADLNHPAWTLASLGWAVLSFAALVWKENHFSRVFRLFFSGVLLLGGCTFLVLLGILPGNRMAEFSDLWTIAVWALGGIALFAVFWKKGWSGQFSRIRKEGYDKKLLERMTAWLIAFRTKRGELWIFTILWLLGGLTFAAFIWLGSALFPWLTTLTCLWGFAVVLFSMRLLPEIDGGMLPLRNTGRLGWVFLLAFYLTSGRIDFNTALIALTGMGMLLILLGRWVSGRLEPDSRGSGSFWQEIALEKIVCLFGLVILYLMTFSRILPDTGLPANLLPYLLLFFPPLLALLLWKMKKANLFWVIASAGLALIVMLFPAFGTPVRRILANAAFLGIGIGFAVHGIRSKKLLSANFGACLCALLVITRFLDISDSFLIRGSGFMIAAGILFLVNWFLRKAQSTRKETSHV